MSLFCKRSGFPYDRLASRYEAGMRPLDRWFLRNLRVRALDQLPSAGRVLEIGAGTGLNFFSYPVEARGVASEPSREMLKLAREKQRPRGVALVQNCAEYLPFEDSCFDAAFATLVFCSVESPARAFGELRRVVRKGGMVVLLEHVRPGGVLGPIFDVLNLLTVWLFDDHLNRRTADEARAAGLDVIIVRRIGLGVINLITCRV